MDPRLIDYGGVGLLGALVGAGELISVFRDAPTRALLTKPAIFYVLVNVVAAVAALFLTRVFGWSAGAGATTDDALRVTQVLVAGIGAMALFRSSLTIRAGEKDVSISPSVVLE